MNPKSIFRVIFVALLLFITLAAQPPRRGQPPFIDYSNPSLIVVRCYSNDVLPESLPGEQVDLQKWGYQNITVRGNYGTPYLKVVAMAFYTLEDARTAPTVELMGLGGHVVLCG